MIAACAALAMPCHCRADDPVPATEATMDYSDAVVLGSVEGITEYLPVSSTGHLILTSRALGIGGETSTADGTRSAGAQAVDNYLVVIQAGAIAAVAILYWRDLLAMLMGLFGKDRNGLRLGINLVVAFLPAAVLGLLLNDWIEEKLFGPIPVAVALALGAPLMLGIEWWRKRDSASAPGGADTGKELHSLSCGQCLFIGAMQAVAMCPGTSRSMMTIVGGYIVGLTPVKSARFSFLLGFITLSAATVFTLLKHGREMAQTISPGPALVGLAVATLTAALSVKWLVSYLSRHGLALFAYYRVVLALIILAVA
ncbi:MAG TPA: undecaprenyl-diphosphate phosphatase [Opitutales bacterium]|nr:undecaprenyl-diphosphate phosphatase [Opitutales bacterium]